MKILFACDVIPHPTRNGYISAMEMIRNGPAGSFPCDWEISVDPPIAVGVADVTAGQLGAIDQDSRVIATALDNRLRRLSSMTPKDRGTFESKMVVLGVPTTGPDTIEAVWQRMLVTANPVGRPSIDSVLSRLLVNFGV